MMMVIMDDDDETKGNTYSNISTITTNGLTFGFKMKLMMRVASSWTCEGGKAFKPLNSPNVSPCSPPAKWYPFPPLATMRKERDWIR